MRSDRVLDWLDSVVPAHDQEDDDRASSERPPKRTKLNNGRAGKPSRSEHTEWIQSKEYGHRSRLPTPSASGSGSGSPSKSRPSAVLKPNESSGPRPFNSVDDNALMPPKRPRNQNNGNDDALQTDLTPRPPRRSATTAALDDSDAFSLVPSTPSLASSKASKLSRNSSPTKQLRNAELEETGFLRASLRDDQKPRLLHALTEDLRKIGGGFGILPKDLQSDVRASSANLSR